MLQYAKVEDEETGACSVGVGTNTAFYESIGMTLQDVSQSYDGNWYLTSKLPAKPLETAQEEKLNELKTRANAFEQNVCNEMIINSSIGCPMNVDRRSQQNILGQLTIMNAGSLDTIAYRCGDNVTRDLNKMQLEKVYAEALLNGQNLYTQKWNYEDQINSAETVDEVDAIEINFTMMDFSGS